MILALQLVLLIHSGNFEVMEVDINGDGTIDFEEFLGMMKSKANEADQESDLREAFKIFDRDKDGYIDMKELKKVTNNLDQDELWGSIKVACMLGAMLTKDEVDEFMREADVVRQSLLKVLKFFEITNSFALFWNFLETCLYIIYCYVYCLN